MQSIALPSASAGRHYYGYCQAQSSNKHRGVDRNLTPTIAFDEDDVHAMRTLRAECLGAVSKVFRAGVVKPRPHPHCAAYIVIFGST